MSAGTVEGGVTVVMPAYREEANLATTVEDMLGTLDAMGEQHVVVIVNDGSDDRTGEVADALLATYPGRVRVVHHEVNQGYGAAVRTGISTALEHTDAPWLFLTDSDGQFRAAQLPSFVSEARAERADAVIGFRPHRADPLMRKVNAWLWTKAAGLLLGVGARDVDCSYKLVGRRVLEGLELHGDAALISPELLMNIRARGARILQRPVDHYPRLHGEQTGAKLSVILVSLIGLLGLWRNRMRDALPGRALRAITHPRDAVCTALTAAAIVASVAAYLVFTVEHVLLDYPETARGLLISRRLTEGFPSSLAQLGSVWLPLWHLLTAATAWNDGWFYSGLSGSLVSMISYVVATRYLYKTAVALTGNRAAGVIAGVVFAASPNVLYLQAVPMNGLLFMACASAVAYRLTLWCQDGSFRQLTLTAVAGLLTSLTSYTGWALDLATAVIVCYVAWQRTAGLRRAERLRYVEAHLVFYGLPVLTAIAGWLAWNTAQTGNPLHFVGGATANGYPAPPVASSHGDAVLTGVRAMAGGVGVGVLVLAVVGLCYYLATTRLRTRFVAPLALLVFLPFLGYAAQLGASPGSVGVTVATALPAALFIGYLTMAVQRYLGQRSAHLLTIGYVAFGAIVVAALALTAAAGIPALQAAREASGSGASQADTRAGTWLRTHYAGGEVLMQSAGNEIVAFDSHIPVSQIVYENSSPQWQRALADPAAQGIRWIYLRRTPDSPDAVWLALHRGGRQLAGYTVVYSDPDRVIYREG